MRQARGPIRGRARGPGRGLAVALGSLAALLALALLLVGFTGPPERGDSHPRRLPVGIPLEVVARCEAGVGLGGSAPVVALWRDSTGLHVRIGEGGATRRSTDAHATTASALLSCLNVAAGDQPDYPTDSAGLLLLWRYSSTVLWPCFAEHGIALGPTPTRAAFLDGDPLRINPFYRVRSSLTEVQYRQVQVECPLLPSYLRTASPTPFQTADAP